jgi:hypothetical protein
VCRNPETIETRASAGFQAFSSARGQAAGAFFHMKNLLGSPDGSIPWHNWGFLPHDKKFRRRGERFL